jgi:succinate dehydrogenase / fumarate reductase membrane anchor subunit
MAEYYISNRAGSIQWIMQRVSAMLLIVMAAIHFSLQHFSSDAVSTGLTVATRLNNPYWQAYYIVFITLAMYHGINGVVGIVRDYNPRRGLRVGAELLLWTLAGFFVVLGIRNITAPVPLGTVKESYAARGFPKGPSPGNPPSYAITYDFRDELRELSLLEYYLEHHVHRTEGAPIGEVFAHDASVRLLTMDKTEAAKRVATSGEAFDRWAKSVIAAGPVDPALRHRLSAFSSTYEFAVWAAQVRLANAELRGDTKTVDRWEKDSSVPLPDYSATELH